MKTDIDYLRELEQHLMAAARRETGPAAAVLKGRTGLRWRTFSARLVARVRPWTDLPLVAGYGITTAEQVAQAAGFADGVVVGSALIALMEGLPEEEIMLDVAGYVRALKEATTKMSV